MVRSQQVHAWMSNQRCGELWLSKHPWETLKLRSPPTAILKVKISRREVFSSEPKWFIVVIVGNLAGESGARQSGVSSASPGASFRSGMLRLSAC